MSKANAVLINPPYGLNRGRAAKPSFSYHPLSLWYRAASLLKNGIRVRIIDAYLEALNPERIMKRIKDFKDELLCNENIDHIFIGQAAQDAQCLKYRAGVSLNGAAFSVRVSPTMK